MKFMVIGSVLVLSSLGLYKFGYDYLGIISFGIGFYFLMKGRDVFEKVFPPKPWESGPD